MRLHDRDSCLYCELDGISTPLIPSSRGGFCPEHGDEAFIEILTAPQPISRDPLLRDVGIPTRNGKKAA